MLAILSKYGKQGRAYSHRNLCNLFILQLRWYFLVVCVENTITFFNFSIQEIFFREMDEIQRDENQTQAQQTGIRYFLGL